MTAIRHVSVGNVTFGNDLPFALIAGPCVLESRAHALMGDHLQAQRLLPAAMFSVRRTHNHLCNAIGYSPTVAPPIFAL